MSLSPPRHRWLATALALLLPPLPRTIADEPPIDPHDSIACSAERFNISILRDGKLAKLTDTNRDFKPVSDLAGKTLVFFRVQTYGDGSFETWRTAICVIHTDGSGFRQLTSGDHADYNPTFTRDGTNRIVFNRYNQAGDHSSEVFLTSPSAAIGQEQKISHPTIRAYEWAYSCLKDGRILVHRITSAEREVYLLTPNPGGEGKYERIHMPDHQYVHKLCIAPSETKVTYMYDLDNNGATYNDARIAWAQFDPQNLRVSDPVYISPDDPSTIDEYPKWSPDESLVYYDSNKADPARQIHQIYAHRIADHAERDISPDPTRNAQFPCVLGCPK